MKDLLPDLFDHYSDDLALLTSRYTHFGHRRIFWGEIVTVKCFEDNSKVKQILNTNGKGKVLVVDGAASMERALLGDMIALCAVDNCWEGIVINGCVRDAGALKEMELGVLALGTNPIKTVKKDVGEINVPLQLDNINVEPGMMIYCDENGIGVAKSALALSCLL